MRLLVPIAAAAIVAFQGNAADPAVAAAMERGEALLITRKYEEALREFKQANDLQNKQSAAALFGVARAYHSMGAYKTEAEACADGLKFAGGNKSLAASLHNQRGMALAAQAEKNTDKIIKDAEAEFRAVLALTDAMPIASYNLGVMLMRQSRDDEGREALQAYVDSGGRGPQTALARSMIANPRRAREPFAPEFSFTSLDGDSINSRDLAGKVVLLDFWGTWCGPCLAATADLVRIHRKYSADPRFVMIGISSDPPQDKGKVIDYIADKKMNWIHVQDVPRRAIHLAFDVVKFPTYIVIDHEGVMTELKQDGRTRTRLEGWGTSMPGAIEDGIKRALKRLTSSASSPDSFARLGAPGSSWR
jgi:thiol-disulfide isomerase/thioredoxin